MKNEFHMKQILQNYVGTFGLEAAITELPERLNLNEVLQHCLAPQEAVLHMFRGQCCGHTVWFIQYDSFKGSALNTVYFQITAYTLKDAVVQSILALIKIGILDFNEYERKLYEYNR